MFSFPSPPSSPLCPSLPVHKTHKKGSWVLVREPGTSLGVGSGGVGSRHCSDDLILKLDASGGGGGGVV